MSPHECVLCGDNLTTSKNDEIRFGFGNYNDSTAEGKHQNRQTDEASPFTVTSTSASAVSSSSSSSSSKLCLESILNLWEIPTESTDQLLPSSHDDLQTENLTLALFCNPCIKSNQEIMDMTQEITILTGRIQRLKLSLESKFRSAYKKNDIFDDYNNPLIIRDLSSCHSVVIGTGTDTGAEVNGNLVQENPILKLETFGEDDNDCRIQHLATNLKELFAQSLLCHSHDHSGAETPADNFSADPLTDGNDNPSLEKDPIEIVPSFDLVDVDFHIHNGDENDNDNHEVLSLGESTSDSEKEDPSFIPSKKRIRIKAFSKLRLKPTELNVNLEDEETGTSNKSEHKPTNSKSKKSKKAQSKTSTVPNLNAKQDTELKYTLPPQVELKEVSIQVQKLSSEQFAKFSLRLRPRPGPSPGPCVNQEPSKKSRKQIRDEEALRLPCPNPTCKKSFLNAEDRDYHNMTKHEGITHPFTCEECGRRSRLRHMHLAHVDSHRGVFRFKCDICGYSFIRAAALKEHLLKHSTEATFKCKLCPRAYKGHQGLKYHMRKVHTGEKPYTCHTCGKNFVQSDKLKRHMDSVHAKEKPLMCPVCGKLFTIQNYLYMHMRIHNGMKPFPSSNKGRKNNNTKNNNNNSDSDGQPQPLSQPQQSDELQSGLGFELLEEQQQQLQPPPFELKTDNDFEVTSTATAGAETTSESVADSEDCNFLQFINVPTQS